MASMKSFPGITIVKIKSIVSLMVQTGGVDSLKARFVSSFMHYIIITSYHFVIVRDGFGFL